MILRRKGPQKPEFAYDIFRIHSLMLNTDLIKDNFIRDTKAPLLPCFPSISKLKLGDVFFAGQYMNHQTFKDLQFGPLLQNSFYNIYIDLKDKSGQKIPFLFVGITRLVSIFDVSESLQHSILTQRCYNMVASTHLDITFNRDIGQQRGRGFGALAQKIGRTAISFLWKYIV